LRSISARRSSPPGWREQGGKAHAVHGVAQGEGSSTSDERAVRRAQYAYPEGCRPVSKYWLQTTDPSLPHVVATYKADSAEAIMALVGDWDDHFHITVVPSMTAEQGLRAIEQMMQAGREQA
jgi:uncharacterized protein DUF3303